MKYFAKIILTIAIVYMAVWITLAAYFSVAERHKGLLESSLTNIFNRSVTIERVRTSWHGLSPTFQILGFEVEGDTEQAALSFASLSAKLDPLSILMFWPKFTDIAIDQPELEIANLSTSELQIAGFVQNPNRSAMFNPQTIISWLLNHERAVWHDGTIVRRRLDGEIIYYPDISFIYERIAQNRTTRATIALPEGKLAFKVISNGDLIDSNNWDASLEVLSDKGQSFLSSDDLSLNVSDGRGRLQLRKLGVQQIRDFLQLTGMVQSNNWVFESQLSGELSDLKFDFSGAFLDFTDWSFAASATQVSFSPTDKIPAMTNLNGAIVASRQGGKFDFATRASEFSWPRWFDRSLPVTEASGQFEWDLTDQNEVKITLDNGFLSDEISQISNIAATVEVDVSSNRIQSVADLFKVNSLQDLSFTDGEVVSQTELEQESFPPIFLDATAQMDVSSLAAIRNYLPNDPRITKFEEWWRNAMLQGSASDGRISYQGRLTRDALYDGTATLSGQVDFNDVMIDYGYQDGWPIVSNGNGVAIFDNAKITFLPDEVDFEGVEIDSGKVVLNSLFKLDRSLDVEAEFRSDIPQVMEFLFAGPLLKPEFRQATDQLPVKGNSGDVDAQVFVTIPLARVREASARGIASVSEGELTLPEGIMVSNISGDVSYTHNSAQAGNITGRLLGGSFSAELNTLQEAQPPELELIATGNASAQALEPWIGKHLLSWMEGQTNWQGRIVSQGPTASINVNSQLLGLSVNTPAPLGKTASEARSLDLQMHIGKDVEQNLTVNIGDDLVASFAGNKEADNNLLDRSIISFGGDTRLKEGINFDIRSDQIDIDAWLSKVIDLANIETQNSADTRFLDSMRSINISSSDPKLLGRQFGDFKLSAVSRDGKEWIGSLSGENIDGVVQAQPRSENALYRLNLSKLHLPKGPEERPTPTPIDRSLQPQNYPTIDLNINSFRLVTKQLGHLRLRGEAVDNAWQLTNFELNHQGITSTAEGRWVNTEETGTITSFDVVTVIDEAGGALQELDMEGVISRGDGGLQTNINWIGAPHEFEYSRLNGEFDLRVEDGELVNIEPGGSGKLLGLLNFNAIARRLTLDFRDIFSSGLEFDRMRYAGIIADGQAIMREAYVFTPAVFVTMEGKLDLDQELIDMEIHMSPELGGNLTLLSALANPAAGAVVFLTQQIFKDEMRAASFRSYRALGPWDDFEIVEFDLDDLPSG